MERVAGIGGGGDLRAILYLAAAGGLAVASILLISVLGLDRGLTSALIGAAAAAVIYTLALYLTRRARRAMFEEHFGADPNPVLLIDSRGRILRANPAAGDVSGDLADFLDSDRREGERLVFRLGRAARDQGQVEHAVAFRGVATQLIVRDCGGDTQIWQLVPPVADPKTEDGPSTLAEKTIGPGSILDQLPIGLARVGDDGVITYVNAAARALIGERTLPGARLADLIEGLHKTIPERLQETLRGRDQGRSEVASAQRDGADVFLQVTMIRVFEGQEPMVLAVVADATELKTLEAQFVQSQKMQAVGQLAGGIAHDFNNLLTAIHGHCDLLLLRHDNGDPDHGDLVQIRQNANRAAALVRQLLAFSRKQTLRLNVLHLYDTMQELAHLLNRLLGEKVVLKIENLEEIWPVRVDERQLEQVVVNLVVNARDAMPEGGIVHLRTRNVTLSEELKRDRATVPAGRYSVIEVEDTGVGIEPKHLNKVFEPFYTTKRVGEGTGLGLSTAYGIVKQTGGFIFVDSTVGTGTRFSIYLPVYSGAPDAQAAEKVVPMEPPPTHDLTGRGVVLLVEDEAPVRSFAARALRMRGYEVLEADCGEAALEVLRDGDRHVDLFVSDVIMPGLDGPSWVREALQMRTDVSTIFVSGYAEDAFDVGKDEIPRSSFLAKPFSLNDLTTRVREHMDRYTVRGP
ncbi:MAG: ATP-binding protein [Pseudomonadota bacterium]